MTTTLTRNDYATKLVIRQARKALRKTPEGASEVIMTLPGEVYLQAAEDLGWALLASSGVNYASAVNHFTVRKARAEVVLDTAK